MIYLPSLRRFLLPIIILLTIVLFVRSSSLFTSTSFHSFIIHAPPHPQEGIHVPISSLKQASFRQTNLSQNYLSPPRKYFYTHSRQSKTANRSSTFSSQPHFDQSYELLFRCPAMPNRYTGHIRFPYIVQNISQVPPGSTTPEHRIFWNPTMISLPFWSQNQYLLVSRIVTGGRHQQNVICEANICYTGSDEDARPGEKRCTEDDLLHLGPAGGLRCSTPPMHLSVPPTPAEKCEGKFYTYTDIPGFHDPRVFWSGKGEPLMMLNTQYVFKCPAPRAIK